MTKVKTTLNNLIDDIIQLVDEKRKILLSSHVGPDGDSLGSQISFYYYLKSLNKDVYIYNEGHIPHYFHDFPDIDKVIVEPDRWIVPESGFDLAVIFECTQIDRIGDVSNLIGDETDIVNIDHHLENTEYGRLNYIDVRASSVGEMNYRILRQAGFKIDMQAAEYIYTAIMTDTGRFHFSSTTPECMRIAAEMIEIGVNVKDLTDKIYFGHSENQVRLMADIVSRMELFLDGKVCFLTLRKEDLQNYGLKYGDMEGLVEWTMRVRGVEVGALFKDISPDFTKISLRSQGNIDVCRLAKKFDGGGHLNASGCHMKTDLESAKADLLRALEELLNK